MTIAVIIPAAGTGTRFGGQLPKQFHPLAGKPLIQHVIERFLLDENVTRVIVPVAEMLLGSVKNSERVVWVAGGATRQQSVIRGLAETRDAELIAVHDAARPLFSEATFHAVVAATREFGAALPVVPVTDTIHAMSDDATVRETLDRSRPRRRRSVSAPTSCATSSCARSSKASKEPTRPDWLRDSATPSRRWRAIRAT